MLDPSKRRQRAAVWNALEPFRCPHGEPVALHWHPHRADGWFDIEAHCDEGLRDAGRLADAAFARVRPAPAPSP